MGQTLTASPEYAEAFRHSGMAGTVSPTRCSRRICVTAFAGFALSAGNRIEAEDGPDPIFEKPAPITMAELAKRTTEGVSALEVSDYAPGHYTGALTPSPPHADMNAKKAVVVFWKDHAERFVFSHEASYCPYLELPNGAGMCNQFFEGNLGKAELFNNMGRKEKNSFVDVVQSGPNRVWVRWTYFAVNMKDDSQPRLARHGGLYRLSERTGSAADDLREPHAERDGRLQHRSRRTVRRGAGRLDDQGSLSPRRGTWRLSDA